jgi:hypothetical protein
MKDEIRGWIEMVRDDGTPWRYINRVTGEYRDTLPKGEQITRRFGMPGATAKRLSDLATPPKKARGIEKVNVEVEPMPMTPVEKAIVAATEVKTLTRAPRTFDEEV